MSCVFETCVTCACSFEDTLRAMSQCFRRVFNSNSIEVRRKAGDEVQSERVGLFLKRGGMQGGLVATSIGPVHGQLALIVAVAACLEVATHRQQQEENTRRGRCDPSNSVYISLGSLCPCLYSGSSIAYIPMVSTRRAQASATPPTTPSAERHGQVAIPHSAPGSGIKMSKELRRLTIDANPSLGGVASSSANTRNTRRSGMRQELLPTGPDTTQAPTHLLPDGGVLLTPSPSDSPASPHLIAVTERVPSPPAGKQSQTSDPQPSKKSLILKIKSPVLSAKAAGKRKITQYFTAMPQQTQNNKRRKIDNDTLDPPALQTAVSVPEPPVVAPTTLPTAASAPELKEETYEELDPVTSSQLEETLSVIKVVQVPQKDKEPDKPHDTDQEQPYMTAEEDRHHNDDDDPKKKEEEEKLALKRERELKRLQIDAKPALIDKRSRRQTTLPPARAEDADSRLAKRQRHSLPAPASDGPSKAAVASTSNAVHVLEEALETFPDPTSIPALIEEAKSTPAEPNPPVFPAGTNPKLLASGEVNDEWLTQWLGYVAHITGDEETSKILAEEDVKELIKPDRSDESDQDRQKRISNELDMVAGWNVVGPQEEAIQSSPEQAAPVKPPPKKKKQRFNPKPKGQPYIPKAKKKAQELAAKKLAKKQAEAEAGVIQEATPVDATANGETGNVLEAIQPPQVQETEPLAEAPTDWLTDLMNATEPVNTDGEQPNKTKKSNKGKGKAKVS